MIGPCTTKYQRANIAIAFCMLQLNCGCLKLSLYVPLQVEEYKDEVFDLLDNGAHIYFCGLKGMMPGIQDMLARVAAEKGLNFEEWVEKLKHNNQWHVEVY